MQPQQLPPASEVRVNRRPLQSIRSPSLTGWCLSVAVWFLESFLGAFLLRSIWIKSGIYQVLRETKVPESPSFLPVWQTPETHAPGICIDELDAQTRAAVAAHTIPGFSAIREIFTFAESGERARRWEIADFAQAYSTRLATPTEVANRILLCLKDFGDMQPPMRFLVSQDAEDLLLQAENSSRRHARGEALSPLDGVPYAVIDAIDAMPYLTTAGTQYLAQERPVTEDAPCIAALRQAGAMLVGKTVLHELGVGMTGINPRTGTARNPYAPSRCAGGSSSGSAAMVSAGLCAFALGVDGGGSIRVPAALCGVVALKPTAGRTAREGCPENAAIMSIGPITASVGDAMLVNAVISNAGVGGTMDPLGPTTIYRSLFDSMSGERCPLGGKQVGVDFSWLSCADSEVAAAFNRSLKYLAQLGCRITEVTIPELELARVAQMVSIGCEIAEACKHAYANPRKRRQMNLETRVTLASTSRFLATDYLQAQKIRTRLLTHFRQIFTQVDLLATPTVGITAPVISEAAAKHGESNMRLTERLMLFTIPINMAGLPALTLSIGQDSQGLPIGIQLVGQPWKEAELLYTGSAMEVATRSSISLPQISCDVLYGLQS